MSRDPEDLLAGPGKLTDEEATRLLWKMVMGYDVRPWTEGQEMAMLLGSFTCLDGHVLSSDQGQIETGVDVPICELSYFTEAVRPFLSPQGRLMEDSDETSETVSKYQMLRCLHPDHPMNFKGEESQFFYVPESVFVILYGW